MPDGELNIDPSVLTFPIELRKKIQSAVTLSNSSDENVAFKIRTTAPRQYCVRPSQGVVMPGKRTTISIVMQPMDSWPAESASKDKFMVQSCTTTLTDAADFPTDMFTDEKDLKKVKLKVVHKRMGHPPVVLENSVETADDEVMNGGVNVGSSEATELFGDSIAQQSELDKLRSEIDSEIAAHNLTKSLLAKQKRSHETTTQDQSTSSKPSTTLILVMIVALFAFLAGRLSD